MSSEPEHLARILERAMNVRRTGDVAAEEPPAEVCPKCQGAGYLRYDVPVDDPRFGELIICSCTRRELEERRQHMLLEKSQLAELQHLTFGTWKRKIAESAKPPATHPDAAFVAANAYAHTLQSDGRPWLFLFGTKGTGKTHLAAAIGHYRILIGQPAIFMVVPDLLDHLRATFSPNSDSTYDDLFENLRNTPLLILDDLGTHASSPWAREKLFQLINHRYNRRLPTVVTMNEEAEDIDPRLWSRINDATLTRRCDMRADDYRTREQPPQGSQPRRRKIREEYHV